MIRDDLGDELPGAVGDHVRSVTPRGSARSVGERDAVAQPNPDADGLHARSVTSWAALVEMAARDTADRAGRRRKAPATP